VLTSHRKQQILSLLKQNGQIVAKEVSLTMGVSEDTIRRDLRELAQEGVYNGCMEELSRRRPQSLISAAVSSCATKGRSRSEEQRPVWCKMDKR
jgi:DeoR/GlpR family transcriptional regulator of sugar metabolism